MSLQELLNLSYANDLMFELHQCAEEGKDVTGLRERIEAIQALAEDDPEREELAARLLDETIGLPVRPDFPYHEPSDLAGIHGARPEGPRRLAVTWSDRELEDHILGGWLGRCAGCLLGKPVEGWRRERIVGLNRAIGNYPIRGYMDSRQPEEVRKQFEITDEPIFEGKGTHPWVNNVSAMPEDDDINYTIIGLIMLERYGFDFTPEQVAEAWLWCLPVLRTCTAERRTYRSLLEMTPAGGTASRRNVYREWIGAQIRADAFGYAAPGALAQAAAWAWRDGSISHVKNGIYGEMWVAAMLAAAATTSDPLEIVRLGLSEIPARSRLAAEIQRVIGWRESGVGWEEAFDRIHAAWDEALPHHWCHTIPNAMIVTVGLLWGEGDLEASIGKAVIGALDTDCNGATVGSVIGMMRGARALPKKWTGPLKGTIRSDVDGFSLVPIADLARRTAHYARQTIDQA